MRLDVIKKKETSKNEPKEKGKFCACHSISEKLSTLAWISCDKQKENWY